MSPCWPCATSSKTTTIDQALYANAQGGQSGDAVIQADDTVIG